MMPLGKAPWTHKSIAESQPPDYQYSAYPTAAGFEHQQCEMKMLKGKVLFMLSKQITLQLNV